MWHVIVLIILLWFCVSAFFDTKWKAFFKDMYHELKIFFDNDYYQVRSRPVEQRSEDDQRGED